LKTAAAAAADGPCPCPHVLRVYRQYGPWLYRLLYCPLQAVQPRPYPCPCLSPPPFQNRPQGALPPLLLLLWLAAAAAGPVHQHLQRPAVAAAADRGPVQPAPVLVALQG
jgi:hypothetical protein